MFGATLWKDVLFELRCTVQYLLASILLFLHVSVLAEEPSVVQPSPSRAEYTLLKIAEADEVCSGVTLSPTVERDTRTDKKRITERPVALCAWSEATSSWHVVIVNLEYPVPQAYVTCIRGAPTLALRKDCVLPYRVVTPGYRTEHVRGYGITRLSFNVYAEKITRIHHGDEVNEMRTRGEKLTVYRTRHMWLDDEALASGDVDRVIATATAKNYTPHHPDLDDKELVLRGARFLFDHVRGAQSALGLDPASPSTVRSRAFPERALGRVVARVTAVALAIIEQMDDMTFEENREYATDAVLTEYALNREDAFRFSQSGANAIGPLQFTDAGGNGTYSAMVREYPGANINPNFEVGARDLHNVLKAAIALIDWEVYKFPEIKPLFLKNPQLGGAFPVAAYNGGPSSARALYAWLRKHRVNILRKEVVLPNSFTMKRIEKCPCKGVDGKKGKKKGVIVRYVINAETPGYLTKYLYLLNYLAEKEFE